MRMSLDYKRIDITNTCMPWLKTQNQLGSMPFAELSLVTATVFTAHMHSIKG